MEKVPVRLVQVRQTQKRRKVDGSSVAPWGTGSRVPNSQLNRTKLWQRLKTEGAVTVEWGQDRSRKIGKGDHNGVYGRRDRRIAFHLIKNDRVDVLEAVSGRYVLKIKDTIDLDTNIDHPRIGGYEGNQYAKDTLQNPYAYRWAHRQPASWWHFKEALDVALVATCGGNKVVVDKATEFEPSGDCATAIKRCLQDYAARNKSS